jgi:uncharacterized protein (DUF1501 family)
MNTSNVSLSRRRALCALGATALAPLAFALPRLAAAATPAQYRKLLVLIELKGGNDGFNTLVPFADPAYYALRPKIGIARDTVVQLSDKSGLHPALAPLLPLWNARQLAILRGVGYPEPNLSHFRSIEIWDTASASEQYLQEGWLTRTFVAAPPPRAFTADGVIIGSNDLGPLAGDGARTVALANTDAFLRQARLVVPQQAAGNKALHHIVKVEGDILQAAANLDTRYAFRTEFPTSGFGFTMRTACRVIANPAGVAVLRVTLTGFDTHTNQPATQARLLGELAQGIVALHAALAELSRWDDTLVLTYAEFGRRPRENLSQGTDHGTANVHFALGGRVTGGFYGDEPSLAKLNGDGNTGFALDFRNVYATVLERWWNLPSTTVLGGRYAPIEFVRT